MNKTTVWEASTFNISCVNKRTVCLCALWGAHLKINVHAEKFMYILLNTGHVCIAGMFSNVQ